jgi:hypothetical protein
VGAAVIVLFQIVVSNRKLQSVLKGFQFRLATSETKKIKKFEKELGTGCSFLLSDDHSEMDNTLLKEVNIPES